MSKPEKKKRVLPTKATKWRKVETEESMLPIPLTPPEIVKLFERGQDHRKMAKSAEAQRVTDNSSAKTDIATLITAAEEIEEQAMRGAEDRLIECETVWDYRKKTRYRHRMDTGETFDEHPITADQAQMGLDVLANPDPVEDPDNVVPLHPGAEPPVADDPKGDGWDEGPPPQNKPEEPDKAMQRKLPEATP